MSGKAKQYTRLQWSVARPRQGERRSAKARKTQGRVKQCLNSTRQAERRLVKHKAKKGKA